MWEAVAYLRNEPVKLNFIATILLICYRDLEDTKKFLRQDVYRLVLLVHFYNAITYIVAACQVSDLCEYHVEVKVRTLNDV